MLAENVASSNVWTQALLAAADGLDPRPSPYEHNPVQWLRDSIIWKPEEHIVGDPYPDGDDYQALILTSLATKQRCAVWGPHGLGKTTTAAWAILWFAKTREGRDWKIVTTASKWRQLIIYLWPEIHKWNRRLREPFSDKELLSLNIKLATGQASAVASDQPGAIEGAHADHLLYIIDEAKEVQVGTWDAIEGAFSTDTECLALAISTPGPVNGRLWDIASRKPGTEDWSPLHITLEMAIAAGRISSTWAEQRKRLWGEKSTVYRNRVLGEFAAASTDGVIPELSWIEDANDRWKDIFGEEVYEGGWDRESHGYPVDRLPAFTCVGVDVARGGADKTTMALRFGAIISDIRETELEGTDQTTGRVMGILRAFKVKGPAVVDVIGVGGGVVDFLRAGGYLVQAFNAAEGTTLVDSSGELGFTNKRSAGWWAMRELLDPANNYNIALPPSDMLTGDLLAPGYRVVAGGRIQVESKDDIKKRIGRSTDYADSVVQAFQYDPDEVAGVDGSQMVYDAEVSISPF